MHLNGIWREKKAKMVQKFLQNALLQVAELEKDDPAHLFYLQQNAVIKAKGPHRICCQLWQSPEWLEGKKEVNSNSPKCQN